MFLTQGESHIIFHCGLFIMRKWAFILFIALLAASCNSIINSSPSGTLSEKQMTDILVDIHLSEASLSVLNDSIARLNNTTQLRIRFADIFAKHNIDPDDFNTSLTYYLGHIEELDKIYVEVINRLTELEATLQPKPEPNSIRLNPDQNRMLMRNIWFKSMNKTNEPEAIQYFSPTVYRVEKKISYPEPVR
jgi:hypothetical protein